MKGTLLVGDYLFVSKFSYGYSHYSLPLSPPLFSGRILVRFRQLERGDVVVFRLPADDSTDYIKRVDRPSGRPHPDDRRRPAHQRRAGEARAGRRTSRSIVVEDQNGRRREHRQRVTQWRETLPNGVSYNTLDAARTTCSRTTPTSIRCLPDNYFMMGDNRHNSTDSRFPQVGYVPFENIIGRAQIIFFSVTEGERAWEIWRWPWSVRWTRLFSLVR